MSMRHLRFLRYVDEVARAGSIRKAADVLHVTASAVNVSAAMPCWISVAERVLREGIT